VKFSEQTLRLVKSFSAINQSMLFRPGNVLSICTPNKTVVARAETDDNFEEEFAIYDLPKLLSVLSLFETPDINLEKNRLVISRGKSSVSYATASPTTIVVPPQEGLTVVKTHAEFNLSKDDWSALQKVISVLGAPDVQIVGANGKIELKATSKKNTSASDFVQEVGETDKNFVASLKQENLKMIAGDYKVQVAEVKTKIEGVTAPVVYFQGTPNDKLTQYWVVLEAEGSRMP
jgi:hypothetical protein